MKISLYYPHSMLHNCASFKILSRFTEFWGDLFPQKYTEKELVEKIDTPFPCTRTRCRKHG